MIIKKLAPALAIAGLSLSSTLPVHADIPTATAATATAKAAVAVGELASKSLFLKGLEEPQGLALDKNGNLLLCEYGNGEILRYDLTGKLLGVVATGLKGPAQIVLKGDDIFVSERKANRIIQIGADRKVIQLGGTIDQPLGLTMGGHGELVTVSHTISKLYRYNGKDWKEFYAPPLAADGEDHYGYRCLAYDGSFLLSDEDSEQVMVITPGGRAATWSTAISNPSGITIGPDGNTYVCNEDGEGQVVRLDANGKGTIVAEGVGRARNLLFLDAKTALVSDRNGNVWKLNWK